MSDQSVSDIITHTAKLVPYLKRPRQVASFVTAYAYEPAADEPGFRLGNLYIAMEVLVSGRASEEVADLIIETIGEYYYNQTSANAEPLAKFEAAIKATNQELGQYVNHGNAAWIGKLSAVVAIQVDHQLHIAHTGSAEAFLYRGKASSRITTSDSAKPLSPNKTFGSIVTGQLEVSDRLLLSTPALIHQIPLTRLQSIITGARPNASLAEITQLLRRTSTDRIAALLIEITTPELAALQVRSEQPSEVRLGAPETALEVAKLVTTPIAHTTVSSTKKVASTVQAGLRRTIPYAKRATLALADAIRQILSTKTSRRASLAVGVILIAGLIGLGFYNHSASTTTKIIASYQSAYKQFQRAQSLLDSNDKTQAQAGFTTTQHLLNDLKPQQRTIDKYLSSTTLSESQPRTLEALYALVADRLDQIDGLVKIPATTIATLPSKNAQPSYLELVGTTAYVFDTKNTNSLFIINTTTGGIRTTTANTSQLGSIRATTLSSTGDGIYILTGEPAVWFYRFDNDLLSRQTIAYGQWSDAKAIASYATNLYLLTDDAIYKHTKNATGFSPKSSYLTTTSTPQQHATALAIDGSVYLLSPTGLQRYLAGALQESVPLPPQLATANNLRSATNADVIIATSSQTNRIGLWTIKTLGLTFSKQIAPTGITKLQTALYEPRSGNIYALADNKLIRLAVQP